MFQTYCSITSVSLVDAVAPVDCISNVIGSRVKLGDFSSRSMFAGEFMDLLLDKTRSSCSRFYDPSI